MFINVTKLPSKGYGYQVPAIEMRPLNYERLCEYDEDEVEKDIPMHHLMKDVHYLLSDIKGYKDFLLYDLKSLLFSRKCATIITDRTKPIKTTVPDSETGKKYPISFTIENIHFQDISDDFLQIESVKLGGRKFDLRHRCTIGDLEETFKTMVSRKEEPTMKVLYLSTLLGFADRPNDVKRAIANATFDDVKVLETLWQFINGATLPQTFVVYDKNPSKNNPEGEGRREISVVFDKLISDFFRCVVINGTIKTDSFTVRKGVSS